MGILDKLFAGGASQLVESVGAVADNLITSKEEKMQLELEITKAEQQFQVDMKRLSVEERQLAFQDIDSARKRETAVQTSQYSSKLSKNVSPYLALGTTVLTFALFYIVLFNPLKNINDDNENIVIYILGVLSAILTQIFSYYFGSSMGSAQKNDIIQGMHDKNLAESHK